MMRTDVWPPDREATEGRRTGDTSRATKIRQIQRQRWSCGWFSSRCWGLHGQQVSAVHCLTVRVAVLGDFVRLDLYMYFTCKLSLEIVDNGDIVVYRFISIKHIKRYMQSFESKLYILLYMLWFQREDCPVPRCFPLSRLLQQVSQGDTRFTLKDNERTKKHK